MIELKRSVHTKRKAILEDVVRLAPSIETCSRETFRTYLELAFGDAGLDDRKIATDLGYNVTSVRRWQSGDSCPHKALWKPIRAWIREEVMSLVAGLEEKIAAETASLSEPASNVVPLKRPAPSLGNTVPAELRAGQLAAFAAEGIDLDRDGTFDVDLRDPSGSGTVRLTIRRRKGEMSVRKEGPGQALFLRASPDKEELREMREGIWEPVETSSWRIDAETIGSLFRWLAP